VKAGNDLVLHSPDHAAAFGAVKAAVEAGEIEIVQVNASVERILRAKARLGLHRSASWISAPSCGRGTRAHQALADEVSRRSLTLVKDERQQVPLRVRATRRCSTFRWWTTRRAGHPAPSRTFALSCAALAERHGHRTVGPDDTAEIDLVRVGGALRRVVVSVFVRAASGAADGSRAAARAAAAEPGRRDQRPQRADGDDGLRQSVRVDVLRNSRPSC